MIIADENIPQQLISSLWNNGFEVLSIFESYRGITDVEIIKIAQENKFIILTEDKDFADLVFAYNYYVIAVLLLRYEHIDFEAVKKNVLNFFSENLKKLDTQNRYFIVIRKNDLRIRKLDSL